jgi:hypothetical protein
MGWQVGATPILIAGNTIINTSGMFVYNGAPAAGNSPVFCIATPGTTADPYGNPVTPVTEIGQQSGGHWHWDTSGNADINNSTSQLIARFRTDDEFLGFYAPGGGLGNLYCSMAAAAGTDPDGNTYPAGFFADAVPLTFNSIAVPATPAAGQAALFVDNVGINVRKILPSGHQAPLSDCATDTSTITVTQSTFTAVTTAWSIPSGDAQAGTTYRLTTWGNGVWGNPQQVFNLRGNYTGGSGTGQINIGAVVFSVGQAFTWQACLLFNDTDGSNWVASTRMDMSAGSGTLIPGGAGQQTFGSARHGNGVMPGGAFNLWIECDWASTVGAPTITSYGSLLERLGR